MLISSIEEFKTVDTLFKSCLTTEDKYVASYFVREPALRFHSDRSLVYRVQSGRNIVEGDSSHLRNFLKHCDQSSRWTIQVVERYGPKERVMIQYFAEKSPQALARELFRLQEVVDIASDNASQINHPWMKEVAVQASFSQQGAQELPIPKSSTIEAGNPLDSANPFGEVKANEKLKSASDDVLELFKDIEEIEVDVIGVADEVDNIIQKTLQRAERRARSADN
jgi:hypothetical protein